jgi:CRISPR-associated endonuclease/helicase Cas3
MGKLVAPIQLLWAKSQRDKPKQIHLLIYHLLDSAAVGLCIWQDVLSKSIKQEISSYFSLNTQEMGRNLAYWIALHDIGKASPAFQSQLKKDNPKLIRQISDLGLSFPETIIPAPHSLISGKYLSEQDWIPKPIEIAVSGHHGKWDTHYRLIHSSAFGDESWDSIRRNLDVTLQHVLGITKEELTEIESIETQNLFTAWFSGFICVADWIASNEDYFPYLDKWVVPVEYFLASMKNAEAVLRKAGWVGWQAREESQTFSQMYEFKGWPGPRPIQKQAIDTFQRFNPQGPFIMIVEAPTGIGKTEIALYLADQWLQKTGGSGIYIAMPSQATSNQIYHRSLEILANRYKGQLINLVLAHGQARWNEDVNSIFVNSVGEQNENQRVVVSEWFQNNRKRTLLTPFGVGTVDQVFLSILQTKHFFVRLFGLKNKVVIFDEVHAYDAYMNSLFHRLLEWLRALGVSVIILSATLSDATRREIISSYCDVPQSQVSHDHHYPRITISSQDQGASITPLEWLAEDREIKLHWLADDGLEHFLTERLSGGGCVAVICNTIHQSQKIYQRIKRQKIVDEKDLYIFHARFPFRWRQQIEENVLEKFGIQATRENERRPAKAIVVATQVIEQSLDLDFDLMITELAPVDLILQRAGRLHRHDRHGHRPEKLTSPELCILEVEMDESGLPLVGRREPFYGKSTLLRTYYHLHRINSVKVIANTSDLIEAVYSKEELYTGIPNNFHSQLKQWDEEEEGGKLYKTNQAEFTTIESPDDPRLLRKIHKNLLEDENLQVMEHLKAKTRDGDMGLRIPCLFSTGDGGLFFDSECQNPLPQGLDRLDFHVQKELSQNEITISRIDLIKVILEEAEDIRTYLPYHKHQKFLKFIDGKMEIGGYIMELSKEIGLTYRKGGESL